VRENRSNENLVRFMGRENRSNKNVLRSILARGNANLIRGLHNAEAS
jgi:hypothetical protein